MPFARASDGGRVHFEVHGDDHELDGSGAANASTASRAARPCVVLLMGLGASSHLWLDVPQRLRDDGYRVLAIDNRGTGRSDPLRGPYSLRRMADDVVHVMDAASVERAVLVGISMGGMIAQHAALRHGRRLSGLVLLATTPGLPHGGLPTPRAMRGLLVSTLGARLGPAAGMRLIEDLVLSPADRARAGEIVARIAPAFRAAPTQPASFVWQLLACIMHSTGRHLGRITTPTVVVAGSDDIVMHARCARLLAERIPNAVLEVVPACGHGISFSHPDVVRRAVTRLREGGNKTKTETETKTEAVPFARSA